MADYRTEACPKCGADVIVAAGRGGKKITVDVVAVVAGGTVRLADRGGMEPLAEFPGTVRQFGAKLRRPHVDTCAGKRVPR